MSNRKRLFERGDSYRDTGIPCGNPKRVKTGEVLCMSSRPATAATAAALQAEDMVTQAEEQLKVMAKKQLKTDITMKEALSQTRQFAEAGKYKPVTKEIQGIMGLQGYQDVAKGDQRVETLRQYGLSEDEIRLQLLKEGLDKGLDSSVASKSTLGANPDIQREQLSAIEVKMKEKEASLNTQDSFRGQKEVSRQELDIEKSMFWGTSRDNNALSNLLTKKKSSIIGDPNDPINHLPQMMADIEQRSRNKIREKRRRRRRNRRKGGSHCENGDSDDADDKNNEGEDDTSDGAVIGCLTFEEMAALKRTGQPTDQTDEKTDADISSKITSDCMPEHSGSDMKKQTKPVSDINVTDKATKTEVGAEDNSAVETSRKVLRGHIEFIPEEYIAENRLSLEEIKTLPKFTHYEEGNSSNVLYLKNLSPRTSEHHLVSLFGRFQNKAAGSEVIYKLMTGRMRGQAFITFCDIDVATRALKLVNGFMLHDKPIIVQYGKRTAA